MHLLPRETLRLFHWMGLSRNRIFYGLASHSRKHNASWQGIVRPVKGLEERDVLGQGTGWGEYRSYLMSVRSRYDRVLLHDRGGYSASCSVPRRVAVRKPFLTPEAMPKRLDWCLAHADWDERHWANVIWTDESATHVGGPKCTWITRRPEEIYNADCLQPKFRHLQHCMSWGAISQSAKSKLVIRDKKASGNITSASY